MVRKILLGLVILIGLVLAYAATRPDTLAVERSAVINAPPGEIYAQLHDFRRWAAWSPWERLDPAMQRTHSGPSSGVGAIYEWKGNSDVGQGRMEIIDATPPQRLVIDLRFMEPYEARNTTTFTATPHAGAATMVTWRMEGSRPYFAKLMGLFVNMEQMIGTDFERGLTNLKTVLEHPN
jgi:uncharacterized protein YndB with AHSA1/START domain